MYILGFDIGGTKCAVITAKWDGEGIKLLKKAQCPTEHDISAEKMIEKMIVMADGILEKIRTVSGFPAEDLLIQKRE